MYSVPVRRLALVVVGILVLVRDSHQGHHERRLLKTLLNEDFNPLERPVANDSDPLLVLFGLTLQQILEVKERDQILTTNVWLRFHWYDTYLSWDPKDYGNIQNIRIPPDKIWVPDVLLYNSADERFDGTFHTNVLISSDGLCQWIPPGILRSTCVIDVANFPFDKQACRLKFGSWTYHGFQLDLQKLSEEGDMSEFMPNGEWDLTDISVNRSEFVYTCCPEPYPDITFIIHMKRRTLYYSFNLIIPCVLMSLLTMLSFTLPSDSGEKLALGITLLLAETFFLLIISEKMPPASVVPLIGSYYAATIIMTGISVVFTIVVLNLHHRHPDFYEMGSVTRFIFHKFLPAILCMRKPQKKSDDAAIHGDRTEMVKVGTKLATQFNNYDAYHGINRERAYNKEVTDADCDATRLMSESSVLLRDTAAIVEELRYITAEMRDQGVDSAAIAEWRYAAHVTDRLCLVAFTVWTIVNTAFILISAPS